MLQRTRTRHRCSMTTTVSVQEDNRVRLEKQARLRRLREERNRLKLQQLLAHFWNQIVFLEGKKGKGKTLAAVAIVKQLRDLFGKHVVCIGSRLGLTEAFGEHTFLDERRFIEELDKIRLISKDTDDAQVQTAVEGALASLGIDIMDATLVFDEAYKLFDARTPSDKLVRVFGYFMAQSRHYNITIVLVAPNRDMIDKRVRRQIDWFGRCSTTCRSVPNPETAKPMCVKRGCPHRTTVRFIGGAERFKLTIYGPTYWDLFDTWTRVGFRESHLRIGNL
ncbi:hypothetical protein LCGC14_0799010 [marine sediment metagenome]|uniref:Zona occludens toxin N-terminal domain-containing protein n=1 Tax=marine sediment metagenome TaxID=412755 RepID=A0A0F9SXC7_9ZZZZ